MKRNRKAKILATLGPSSSSPEVIEALFNEGCDVFRLNFSHGSIEDNRKNCQRDCYNSHASKFDSTSN